MKKSAIHSASELILVSEAPDRREHDSTFIDAASFSFQNHLGTTNFLFADGHVKAMKPLATGIPLNMWNAANTTNNGDSNVGPAPTALLNVLGEAQQTLK